MDTGPEPVAAGWSLRITLQTLATPYSGNVNGLCTTDGLPEGPVTTPVPQP